MTSTGQMFTCGALGVVLGSVGALLLPRLLMREHAHQRIVQVFVAVTTTGALILLSWRLGEWPTLLTPAAMTVFGIPLATVDLLEQRLPNVLLAAAYPMIAAAVVASAMNDGRTTEIPRALIAMVALIALYGLIAVMSVSAGGVGAGDVKLAGLIGLTLGWQGWTALLTGTLLGWLLAAVGHLILRVAGLADKETPVPLGAFLIAGTFAVLVASPIT